VISIVAKAVDGPAVGWVWNVTTVPALFIPTVVVVFLVVMVDGVEQPAGSLMVTPKYTDEPLTRVRGGEADSVSVLVMALTVVHVKWADAAPTQNVRS
jgi:hypothetical protein